MGTVVVTILWMLGTSMIIPIGLAIWAAIDLMRSSRSRVWFFVIVLVPVFGPLISLLVGRMPGTAALKMDSIEQAAAKRHLSQLNVQLANWRGPAILVEAGEALIILGRFQEAEAHLREATAAGAPLDEAAPPLARAIAMQGRPQEAIPIVDALLAAHPNHGDGSALELLGQCLDETNDLARAEVVLRRSLERRSPPSLRFRLASVLVRQGKREEAAQLARETRQEIDLYSPAMRRVVAPWIGFAKAIERGESPAYPRITRGGVARRSIAMWVTVALGACVLAACIGFGFLTWKIHDYSAGADESRELMDAVGVARHRALALNSENPTPWMAGDDPASWVVPPDAIDRYLRVRGVIAPSLVQSRALHDAARAGMEGDDEDMPDMSPFVAGLKADAAALESLTEALDTQGSCPRELQALMALVEWRFLRRDGALPLGLAEFERAHWRDANERAGQFVPTSDDGMGDWAKMVARDREMARQEVAALRERAIANAELAPETLALLESRRSELAATEPADVDELVALLDPAEMSRWY